MLKFILSFTFLYALVIALLIFYGISYYRVFSKKGKQLNYFPLIFSIVTAACLSFLYFNMHAPLRLGTYSNLDHHFISHDGFRINGSIILGRSDTTHNKNNNYNEYRLEKKNNQLIFSSNHAEEPFYVSGKMGYHLAVVNYPANGHSISLSNAISIRTRNNVFELEIDGNVYHSGKAVKKALSAWNIFRDDSAFINSAKYTDEILQYALKQVYLLRDDVSKEDAGEHKYFLSARLFSLYDTITYDGSRITKDHSGLRFHVPDNSTIAWGIGFLDNNRNQFKIKYLGVDSFELSNKYPVTYPLTEEKSGSENHSPHVVSKFLVSDPADMLRLPAIYREGFLFPAFPGDSSLAFDAIALNYKMDGGDHPISLQVRKLDGAGLFTSANSDQLILPARFAAFSWVFSIKDSFNWKLGDRSLSPLHWQMWIFGVLLFFFLLVFISSLLKTGGHLSWAWQLLSVITLVLLTTRFFLYWRYQSFPPYDSLDLPSLQQLNSVWNFRIILIVTVLLALVLGYEALKRIYSFFRFRFKVAEWTSFTPKFEKLNKKLLFFVSWIFILVSGGAIAAFSNFDPAVCRHLALALVLLYFLFIYISFRFSPLVVASSRSWWQIRTGRAIDMIISNPVKVLISLSLTALFAFVDMGFAIIFLNFLLFNEAFLCINYAIAGLSSGSKRNATVFGIMGGIYLAFFVINIISGPYIFKWLLNIPALLFSTGYALFALLVVIVSIKLFPQWKGRKKVFAGIGLFISLFLISFTFFPKEKILDKASMTQYRIDVMTMPVGEAIGKAYENGKTYEPVIRAAQNQWFINTFIYEKNNPQVNSAGFNLLPHAPQNKGARYNAQATDLVTSRFLLAEHGRWAVLFYMLILLLPSLILSSFYKLYPDFTNRINHQYPLITTGFSLLNYLLITALLVILAATGRYIFFGQDLPFGSILSKQSILFPALLIIIAVLLFKKVPVERYSNRGKLVPLTVLFFGLFLLLFFVKPSYNKSREFAVADLSSEIDNYIQLRVQPIFDEIDTSKATRRLSVFNKDRLFADTIRKLADAGRLNDAGKFFSYELSQYAHAGFNRHLDQSRLLYLDLNSGHPQLAVNENYFRVEAPPHLQQLWKGNVYSDSSNYNYSFLDPQSGRLISGRISKYATQQNWDIGNGWKFLFRKKTGEYLYNQLCVVNGSDTIAVQNPGRISINDSATGKEIILVCEPDAFMKNYFVNGSRYYVYPMGNDFTWARNFSETISSSYSGKGQFEKNVFISPDRELMDSLTATIKHFISSDTSYKKGAEYGICIADAEGRLIAMPDFIKGMNRPDPNDKAGFAATIRGGNGMISQSLLRKEIGNINLLRMNPGPGSTLKPIVFSAIASQLALDWNAFAAEGFSQRQEFFGGEKVAEYDFEKNNGRIASVSDYLKYSDNYYYADLLLLGSYSKQDLRQLLAKHFDRQYPQNKKDNHGIHWPYFSYNGQQYWLNGFENWPGYINGKANFGSDSSFISIGLFNNYGIYTYRKGSGYEKFNSNYDSIMFREAYKKSGFILPEYALFDQKGGGMDMSKPNEVFLSSFRGHVKGSSQVMVPPVKMLDAFGKLASQNRNYSLTLNPHTEQKAFVPFLVDNSVGYANYLSLIRESVFRGMHEALYKGTAARLGSLLKNISQYHYYAKTGTTGDEDAKVKSKLFSIIISEKDIADPGFNFRNNRFYTIYFTSQKGPAKQNEELQAALIKTVIRSAVFNRYMKGKLQ